MKGFSNHKEDLVNPQIWYPDRNKKSTFFRKELIIEKAIFNNILDIRFTSIFQPLDIVKKIKIF